MTDEKDRALDRLLDTLTPPPPSETLRARLMRDFAPGAARVPQETAGSSVPAGSRIGAIAVAAAVVLAVALGVIMPPAPSAPVMATAGSPTEEDDIDFAVAAFADSAPDSALYMVAALAMAGRDNAPAPDGAEAFEGLPLD